MSRALFLLLCFQILLCPVAHSQNNTQAAYKIGIEPPFINYWLNDIWGYFRLRLEREKPWRKSKIFSNNLSVAWLHRPVGPYVVKRGHQSVLISGYQNIYFAKYSLNFYPLGHLFKSNHLQGLYLGAGPGVFVETRNKALYREGLALFMISGLQFYIGRQLSVSGEVEIFATKNFGNKQTIDQNSNTLWHSAVCLKVGWIFNKKKKE